MSKLYIAHIFIITIPLHKRKVKAMDKKQQQLQFLGFIGIFKESFNIILTKPKIFTYICLAFILPISCISIAYTKIINNFSTAQTLQNQPSFTLPNNTQPYNNFSILASSFPSFGTTYLLINAAFLVFGFVFALFYTAALVNAIACIYINKEMTFKKVVSIVPKVWKPLMITFSCKFCIGLASIVVTFVLTIMFTTSMIGSSKPVVQLIVAIVFMIMLLINLVVLIYMFIYWLLADVISVLEKLCGFKAMKKSKDLVKGKVVTGILLLMAMSICQFLVEGLAKRSLVLKGEDFWIGVKILCVIFCVMLKTLLSFYVIVVETVFYFVCKSYHHENIDKSSLGDHLETFIGEYVPLKNEDLEIGRFQV